MLELSEDCDDSNTRDGDGCDGNCTLEGTHICNNATNMTTGSIYSVCDVALLDLDITDSTTLGYSLEFFYLDRIVYLSDPEMTLFITPSGVSPLFLFHILLYIPNQVYILF